MFTHNSDTTVLSGKQQESFLHKESNHFKEMEIILQIYHNLVKLSRHGILIKRNILLSNILLLALCRANFTAPNIIKIMKKKFHKPQILFKVVTP